MSQREIAYQLLQEIMLDGKYSNLIMRQALMKVDSVKRGYISEVVYGVLRNYRYLRYQWMDLVKHKPKNKIAILIDMAIYLLLYTNDPDYAVVNDACTLAKNQKGFVNAVLRAFLARKEKQLHLDSFEHLGIYYSLPTWIVAMWHKQYGSETTQKILESKLKKATMFYRLNTGYTIQDIKHLDVKQIDDTCFTSKHNLVHSKEFIHHVFDIQDYGSQQIVKLLQVNKHQDVLDACSAPGSKTVQIASALGHTGSLIACDIHLHRLQLVQEKMQSYGFLNLQYQVCDTSTVSFDKVFDRILLDVPCSGLGTLSHKCEIAMRIQPETIDELVALQAKILENITKYVKVNGYFVYSTCTLNKKENEKQIEHFLSKHEDFKLIQQRTIFPFEFDSDGFYMALCQRIK